MPNIIQTLEQLPPQFGMAATTIVIAIPFIVLCRSTASDPTSRAINYMVLITGAALGWVVGIGIAPYTDQERALFSQYAAAIGLFAGGYLAAKLDKIVDTICKPDFVLDQVRGFRILLFISVALLTIIATYIYRTYTVPERAQRQGSPPPPKAAWVEFSNTRSA